MKEDIKDILTSLNEIVSYAEDCVASMQIAFIYNTPLPLKNCGIDTEVIKRQETQLLNREREVKAEDSGLKPYISVSVHILRIWEDIDKLSRLIDKKISENILFSDRTVNETIFLFQRLVEILRPTADIILARNTFLKTYIVESQAGIAKMADEYATLHEDRLIEGESMPASSSLYINILDAVKSIAWHIKEMAVELAG